MGIKVPLDLFGGVSLLLWGLHMVHSGITVATALESGAC